jgi:hypothetical protein
MIKTPIADPPATLLPLSLSERIVAAQALAALMHDARLDTTSMETYLRALTIRYQRGER